MGNQDGWSRCYFERKTQWLIFSNFVVVMNKKIADCMLKTWAMLTEGFVITLIFVCGIALAAIVARIPWVFPAGGEVGASRVLYCGFPWALRLSEVSNGYDLLVGLALRMPVNALFWLEVVTSISCIPSRKMLWKRFVIVTCIGVFLTAVFYGVLFAR